MAVLVSAGIQIDIIDESFYGSAGPGTVPLIVVATASNKVQPSGTGIAPFTTGQMAGRLSLVTSQRDLVQSYGMPIFQSAGGTQMHGHELNEYGLQAAYDYLGISNRAYILRADIDLAQLEASVSAPAGEPVSGTHWLDTSATQWGLFRFENNRWELLTPRLVQEVPSTGGVAGDVAVNVLTGVYYEKTSSDWRVIGSDTTPGQPKLTMNNTGFYPVSPALGDYWIKLRNGADLKLRRYSASAGTWVSVNVPFFATEEDAVLSLGRDPQLGDVYADFSAAATVELRIHNGTGWETLDYVVGTSAPTGAPADGTLWYNADLKVDLLKSDGEKWESFDGELTLAGSPPLSAVADDLWLNTADLENYPALYRFRNNRWVRVDNSNQHDADGIVFADARLSPDSTFMDPDAPDARMYQSGTLLFNTRYSTYNVKEWNPNYFAEGNYDENTNFSEGSYTVGSETFPALPATGLGRWVTVSGNKVDGSPYMGRKAVRQMVVRAMAASIGQSEEVRAEYAYFNLMAAPGYPELIDEMVVLNNDKSNVAFIIGDTPARLAPRGTDISNWANNAAGAVGTGDDGLTLSDPYVGLYYPWGMGKNDGNDVMIPPSTMALRVFAYNDQVSYPWFAPAGYQRGIVQNASSAGYLNEYGEYQTILLNQGLRDVLSLAKINPFYQEAGRGLVTYGQKTLYALNSARDRINVARLDNYLRYNLNILLKPFLFEPNDPATRSAVQVTVERFLAGIVGLRGITDFAAVCNESNNTPERIDRNELWVDIAVVPTKSVEFIYVPVRFKNTGGI